MSDNYYKDFDRRDLKYCGEGRERESDELALVINKGNSSHPLLPELSLVGIPGEVDGLT